MSWESRSGHGRYYTRSRRVNGKVVRQYVGKGTLADVAEAADLLRRTAKRSQIETANAERATWRKLDILHKKLVNGVDLMVIAALENAGYHQHDRGQWRRRRHVDDHANND